MEYVSLVSELNYMTQVVIMLYEDPTKDASSDERFHVELHFSPGVNCVVEKDMPEGPGFRPHSRNHEGAAGQQLQQQEQQRQQLSSSEADCVQPAPESASAADTSGKNHEKDASTPKQAETIVCTFKCSCESLGTLLHTPQRVPEMEASSDTVAEEAVAGDGPDGGRSKAADAPQSDPVPIRRTRSKESFHECDAEQEVCDHQPYYLLFLLTGRALCLTGNFSDLRSFLRPTSPFTQLGKRPV